MLAAAPIPPRSQRSYLPCFLRSPAFHWSRASPRVDLCQVPSLRRLPSIAVLCPLWWSSMEDAKRQPPRTPLTVRLGPADDSQANLMGDAKSQRGDPGLPDSRLLIGEGTVQERSGTLARHPSTKNRQGSSPTSFHGLGLSGRGRPELRRLLASGLPWRSGRPALRNCAARWRLSHRGCELCPPGGSAIPSPARWAMRPAEWRDRAPGASPEGQRFAAPAPHRLRRVSALTASTTR